MLDYMSMPRPEAAVSHVVLQLRSHCSSHCSSWAAGLRSHCSIRLLVLSDNDVGRVLEPEP